MDSCRRTYFKPDVHEGGERLKANLYIREVAHKIIYRIEYNGKFYAVKKVHSDSDTWFSVIIDDKYYTFYVQ